MNKHATQRLFFALWPNNKIRLALRELTAGLPKHGGRDVHYEDLHITLLFLGQTTTERYPCVEEAASGIQAPIFYLKIDTIGYWNRPKIVWCKPSKIPQQLIKLVSDLQKEMLSCGFKPENRAYIPHITLVRKAKSIGSYLIDSPIDWHIGEFVLVTSDSGNRVPRYTVLKRWSLVP